MAIIFDMSKTVTEPVSIVIPTLNEADFVGYLLFSLSRQTYKRFEVIVCDGKSVDGTVEIVKSFRSCLPCLKMVTSPKRSAVAQRNLGEKKALFDRLLFLDADTILPPDFLEKSFTEIKRRRLDCAHPTTFPLTKRVIDQYLYMLTNWGITLTQRFFPLAGGWTIFSTRNLHNKIRGFDEGLTKIYDDVDYVVRAVKTGAHFGILRSSSPYISVRRLDQEGRGGTLRNMLVQAFYFGFFGKYKAQKYINRSFGDFGTLTRLINKERKTNRFLRGLSSEQFGRFIENSKKLWKELWEE